MEKHSVCIPTGMPPCQRLSPVAGPLTAVHQASQLPPINATRLHEITQLPTAGGRRLLRPRPTRGGWAGTSRHESGPHVAATRESLQGAMLLHQSAASKHSLSALACVVKSSAACRCWHFPSQPQLEGSNQPPTTLERGCSTFPSTITPVPTMIKPSTHSPRASISASCSAALASRHPARIAAGPLASTKLFVSRTRRCATHRAHYVKVAWHRAP